MKLDLEMLDILFKRYYEKNTRTATHVFVFSKTQKERSRMFSFVCTGQNYINGEEYSEMRSRDSVLEFNDKDTVVVGVGCYGDVKQKPSQYNKQKIY